MSEEEFAVLETQGKWIHIEETMQYIANMDKMYNLRTRMNPHHPEDQKRQEQRNLRVDQYERWSHIKNLYATHRDELINTFDNPKFEECKSILERIFTLELDDALRDVIDE